VLTSTAVGVVTSSSTNTAASVAVTIDNTYTRATAATGLLALLTSTVAADDLTLQSADADTLPVGTAYVALGLGATPNAAGIAYTNACVDSTTLDSTTMVLGAAAILGAISFF